VQRFTERFVAGPKLEAQLAAYDPGGQKILRIGRKKEVAVIGSEHVAAVLRVVVRSPHADHHVTNIPLREAFHELKERIVRAHRMRTARR